ncbi:MAG: hypothetical protein COA62_04600 [Rhodobiaceae bacterium]|nr:MAG: hypothetical protein COA62_04600 [Rhodobiaceae bacterium]
MHAGDGPRNAGRDNTGLAADQTANHRRGLAKRFNDHRIYSDEGRRGTVLFLFRHGSRGSEAQS